MFTKKSARASVTTRPSVRTDTPLGRLSVRTLQQPDLRVYKFRRFDLTLVKLRL